MILLTSGSDDETANCVLQIILRSSSSNNSVVVTIIRIPALMNKLWAVSTTTRVATYDYQLTRVISVARILMAKKL